MSYSSSLTFVKSLGLGSGHSRRTACPICGKKNTFSVSNEGGQLKWLCFRASCGARGIADVGMTVADVRKSLDSTAAKDMSFELPSYFVNVLSNDSARNYLVKNHSLSAYTSRRADIRYDPKRNRVVFLVKRDGVVIDAVGRSLDGSSPKWWRYGGSDYPFVCGDSSIGVVVEDAASACALSEIATGVALMGTNLATTYVAELRRYDRLIVALDPDAKSKALKMQQLLNWYVPTSVVFVSDDLKHFTPSQIRKELRLEDDHETASLYHDGL